MDDEEIGEKICEDWFDYFDESNPCVPSIDNFFKGSGDEPEPE